jgi:ElaB/YqjD/DUF883 family membrane-anchored ribosome-binding protein
MAVENQMDQGPAVPPQAKEEAKRGETHARESAEDFRFGAGAMVDEYRGHAEGARDDARRRVCNLQDESKQYVRENPTKALFIALCAGFLFGFTFHR